MAAADSERQVRDGDTVEPAAAATAGPKVGPSGVPQTGRVLLVWTVASLIAGGIGGAISVGLGGPLYFGFFFGVALVGLSGLFAVAAHVSKYQDGGGQQRPPTA